MPISINWATKIITVPTDFMTLISGTPGTGDMQVDPALYELDVNALRLALKDIEDSEGMPYLDTHRHNGEVVISGVTYARTFEIINGYSVLFDVSTYDHYTVRCTGANHNIADVREPNTVSLIIGNSAGLVSGGGGGGDASWTAIMEGSLTYQDAMRILLAIAVGKTDINSNIVTFKSNDGLTDRVTATMTGAERTTVVLNPD
jgi:hypothetical protein